MTIRSIEIRRAHIELVAPFQTSFGVETDRNLLYVRVVGDEAEGWGECVAMTDPLYSSEYVDGCEDVLRRYLVPCVRANSTLESVMTELSAFRGNYMAKAALEAALLDYFTRVDGVSLASYLGATQSRVASGVSVGIQPSIDALLEVVAGYLRDGYVRIKLKIEPGWDIEPVGVIRRTFGDAIPLQVDANTAYTRDDGPHLARLDQFDLLLIEQPLPEDDVTGHAIIAKQVATPICLDESIVSARAAIDAIERGACRIINIKAGRVGGYLEAAAIHEVCRDRGVPVWCGGMLETGIGRAMNLALAALPNFTITGDVSASERFWRRDIVTEPVRLHDGHVTVPAGSGSGVSIDHDFLESVTTSRVVVPQG